MVLHGHFQLTWPRFPQRLGALLYDQSAQRPGAGGVRMAAGSVDWVPEGPQIKSKVFDS